MIPFGHMPKTAEEKKVEKPKGPPIACIKKHDGRSYCGREVNETREYMFGDAGHAIRNYKNSICIQACPDCVKQCQASGVGQVNYMAPMATRDIKENTR